MFQNIVLFLDSGGPVLYGVFAISVLLASLILERFYFFKKESVDLCKAQVQRWKKLDKRNSWFATKQREQIVSEVYESFQKHRSIIQLLVIICPLMGLLGTVTGMITVFDTMATTGTGNARAMASGISMATIPTMSGMVISLIGLYFKTRFDGLAKKQFETFKDKLIR